MRINQAVSNAKARAIDWGFGESKNKKTPYLWVKFEFVDLEDDGQSLDIVHQFYLTDNTIENVLRDLERMGWAGKSIAELDKSNENFFDLGRKEVFLTTEMQEYEGKHYPKVLWINENEHSNQMPTLEKEKITEIEKKLRDKITIYRSKKKDDIPF